MRKIRFILLTAIAFIICSCEEPTDKRLCFIGDSIVARWDLQAYFPSCITANYGVGGSGIVYLQEKAGCLTNCSVVVVSGTNDSRIWDQDYPQLYVDAIAALGGSDVLVYSILPRCAAGDDEVINERIAEINRLIKPLVEQKGWQYVDLYERFLDGDSIRWNYFTDGLHLSEQGYEIMAEELKKLMK